jgi:DNA polymerase IV
MKKNERGKTMKNKVRVIFHIDMNAFYTSVEQINNSNLKNKPIAISGKNAIYNKGVILTASYEARKMGVRSAMPVFKAKELCPQLIMVPPHFELYQEYSQKMIEFLKTYTEQIEVASVDEAYLDVTDVKMHPVALAQEIQDRLNHEIGLPSSIGIATNKFLAKMGSDMKKPMGITVLRRREIKEKLWPLKIGDMYGIGKKTAPKLVEAGVQTIGDLVKPEHQEAVKVILANQYERFYQNAWGYGDSFVDPSKNDQYKSIGHSTTFIAPIIEEESANQKLSMLTEMVVTRLVNHQYLAKTLTVQVRYENFKTYSKSITIEKPTQTYETIHSIVLNLFDELWNRQPIRLLGVSSSNLVEQSEYREEYNLFNYEKHLDDEPIIKTMHAINRKYGQDILKKGIKKTKIKKK